METDVPYMMSVKNLPAILDKIQNAGAPPAFGLDFLKDLGFTSSNDRGVIKLLKYLGFLDGSGKPLSPYREFLDHTKARKVLAQRLTVAYDDLFLADKAAHTQTSEKLKGWFKTKTGSGDASAKKMATTFKALASYADFSGVKPSPNAHAEEPEVEPPTLTPAVREEPAPPKHQLGLSYRIEINLPDTTNVDTYRAIFKALREELRVE